MTVNILFFTFAIMATKLKATKSSMIHAIVKGVPVENAANNNEEMMPLPYCNAPINAAAEPTISDDPPGTLHASNFCIPSGSHQDCARRSG